VLLRDLPPIESDEFMPAVREMLNREIIAALQADDAEHEAWLLARLLCGAPDEVRKAALNADP
jgi:hypothetical protein